MGSVYSEHFLAAGQATPTTYIVPAGKRAVVRCVIAVCLAPAAVLVQAWIGGNFILYDSMPAQVQTRVWDMRAVAYAGQPIGAQVSVESAMLLISGYLFNDQAGAAERPLQTIQGGSPPDF